MEERLLLLKKQLHQHRNNKSKLNRPHSQNKLPQPKTIMTHLNKHGLITGSPVILRKWQPKCITKKDMWLTPTWALFVMLQQLILKSEQLERKVSLLKTTSLKPLQKLSIRYSMTMQTFQESHQKAFSIIRMPMSNNWVGYHLLHTMSMKVLTPSDLDPLHLKSLSHK